MQREFNSGSNHTPSNRFNRGNNRADADSGSHGRPVGEAGESDRLAEERKPLRQFDHSGEPGGPTSASENRQRILYWVLPLVVFFIVLGGGIAVTLHLWIGVVERANVETVESATLVDASNEIEETQRVVLRRPASDFVDEPSLLGPAYLSTLGGGEAIRKISSMRTSGTWITDAGTLDFQAIMKTPDMGAFTVLSNRVRQARYMINGLVAWEVLEEGSSRASRSLGDLDRDVVSLASQVYDPVAEVALERGGRVGSITEVEKDGRICLLVEIEQVDGAIVKCYLDRASLRLILEERDVLRDGKLVSKSIRYADYRESSGVFRPHRVSLFYDGELQSEMVTEEVRVNPGLMSSLFSVPSDLSF